MLNAVTHPSCITPPESTCNLCGLSFVPGWTHLMPGNFWTAPCSYINKLLPPLEFKRKNQLLQNQFMKIYEEGLLEFSLWKRSPMTQGVNEWSSGKSVGMV